MAVSIWFGLQLMGRLRLMLDAGYRPIAIPALIAFEAQRLRPLGRDAVIIHQYTRPDCGPSASQWPPGRIGHSLSPCKSSNAEPIARRSRVMGRSSFVELACCCANDKANGGAIAIMAQEYPASRRKRAFEIPMRRWDRRSRRESAKRWCGARTHGIAPAGRRTGRRYAPHRRSARYCPGLGCDKSGFLALSSVEVKHRSDATGLQTAAVQHGPLF